MQEINSKRRGLKIGELHTIPILSYLPKVVFKRYDSSKLMTLIRVKFHGNVTFNYVPV